MSKKISVIDQESNKIIKFSDLQLALAHMDRENGVGEATIRFPDTKYAINLGFSDNMELENNHFATVFCTLLGYRDGQVRDEDVLSPMFDGRPIFITICWSVVEMIQVQQ